MIAAEIITRGRPDRKSEPAETLPSPIKLRAVTVCIASQFKLLPPYAEQQTAAFVLCTDGRLSAEAWGTNDAGVKTHTLGYNFVALMAGDWDQVMELCQSLEAEIQRGGLPASKAEIVAAIRHAVDGFLASGLCPTEGMCECLITGFIGLAPLMVTVRIENGTAIVRQKFHQEAIGSGAFLALAMLRHRAYDPLNADLATACYLTYEAKRFSETDNSVGPKTWLKVHAPMDLSVPDASHGVCLMDVNQAGLDDLERWRREFFLQPASGLRGRPFRRFS